MKTLHIGKFLILSTVLSFAAVSAEPANACSMVVMPEKPRFAVNKGLFIFVGDVIGYTEPVTDPNNFRGSATGLKLKVVEQIQIPAFSSDYIELFRFRHGPDCFADAITPDPPIGTRIRLSLAPARLVANSSSSHVRLESTVFSRIGPAESMFGYSTTANDVFDYKNELLPLAEKFAPYEMANKRQWLDDFLYIEASKDLLRLQRAMTEKARMDILERLLYCPNIDYSYLLHSKVGRSTELLESMTPPTLFTYENKFSFGKAKLSKKEAQLLTERIKLEASGELKYWKNWKDSVN